MAKLPIFTNDQSHSRDQTIEIANISDVADYTDTTRKSRLQSLGDLMQESRQAIQLTQWLVVFFYLVLLIWPVFLPLPKDYVHLYDNLVLFAQFLFWGIWWPFVILSTMLLGRVWCGVFCPEGALSEWSSRYGLNRHIPRWMRWRGWPFVAFSITTIYGQLISVYEYPKAALLILGGSTLVAMLIGFLYGRGKRVWCRYLCPVSGVFSLLARLAPIHFSVDQSRWLQPARQHQSAPDCAPMLSIRTMTGNSDCHMCGRCSGYREAVTLKTRPSHQEISTITTKSANHWDIFLLNVGMLGIATGAFQWSASPWFVHMKQSLAGWLINRDQYWLLDSDVPWWILTHYPQTNDVFSWLDGICILLFISITTAIISSVIYAGLAVASRLMHHTGLSPWHLGYALTPLAGLNVFLGLSALTINMLKAEHIILTGITELRLGLLVLAYCWSGYLLWRVLLQNTTIISSRSVAAWTIVMICSSIVAASWLFTFGLVN